MHSNIDFSKVKISYSIDSVIGTGERVLKTTGYSPAGKGGSVFTAGTSSGRQGGYHKNHPRRAAVFL